MTMFNVILDLVVCLLMFGVVFNTGLGKAIPKERRSIAWLLVFVGFMIEVAFVHLIG